MRALALALGLCLASSLVLASPSPSAVTTKLVDLITKRKYDEFIKELAIDGMDPNQPDPKGRLPLSEAVRTKDIRYTDALIQFGAIANSRDPATKSSPIAFAFQNGLVDIAKMLLAYGADINTADKSGAKPRDFAPTQEIAALIRAWDADGAQAFEDAPGTWVKTKNDAGEQYWYNVKTKDARWNTPPSCAWQRLEFQGQPNKYTNYITSQTVTKLPKALSWRLIRQNNQDLWYNWQVNITQVNKPDELPEDMARQAANLKNVRWYNPRTKEFSWEDPKFQTPWRELSGEGSNPYYYNVVTGESVWEAPAELAWKKLPSDEHPGHSFWHNPLTGESTWDNPGIHEWERHEGDL